MTVLYKCDHCGKTEEAAPRSFSGGQEKPPILWARLSVHMQYNSKLIAPDTQIICFECSAKLGVTERQMEDIDNPAEHLMEILTDMVSDAIADA